ncbi:Hypothetical predicted protein [Olea europaea subsp. europaea]|uniref:Uncharacterized protein n=1 Tax=Olea europaea subsp. europaea TaxID=158383 RepID=A0A8S0URW7_OLEEU|nr:Hypothetical predicted protein [Olea europaea subsp. europaea]
MEGVLMHASAEKPISPYKSHIRNPNKINRPLISRPSDQNILPSNLYAAGVLQVPPPFLYHSYPSFSFQHPPQPPLLPLPTPNPHRTNTTTLFRGLSCPPVNRRAKNSPKKSSKSSTSPRKEDKNLRKIASGFVTVSSNSPLGPDPKDLPKNITKISSSLSSGNTNKISTNSVGSIKVKGVEIEQIGKFSGSVVFTISPPPSSLPLPTFSLRPKLSCNAQAAGIDTGSTDNLRRLLRLP